MTAPTDAGLPEPAPTDAGLPEPAPTDAGLPEPARGDASLLKPVHGEAGLPELVHDGGGPPGPVPLGGPPSYDSLSAGEHLRGHYAGFASRFIAFLFDSIVSIGIFMIVLAAASFAASVLTGTSIHWSRANTWVVVAFFAWGFLYYAYFWTASGKTPGMVLLGVQVVGEDGSSVGTRRGLIRTLAFPLSFILLGLGFLGILLGRDRRALHDVIAGTAVIYCWDAREARLRSLAREGGERARTPGAGSGPLH